MAPSHADGCAGDCSQFKILDVFEICRPCLRQYGRKRLTAQQSPTVAIDRGKVGQDPERDRRKRSREQVEVGDCDKGYPATSAEAAVDAAPICDGLNGAVW